MTDIEVIDYLNRGLEKDIMFAGYWDDDIQVKEDRIVKYLKGSIILTPQNVELIHKKLNKQFQISFEQNKQLCKIVVFR